MERFSWKTYGNVIPMGKTKVWFCAHEDDYGEYFDKVVHDLLHIRQNDDFYKNCVLWYDTSPSDCMEEEELLTALDGMRLFIIPVTRKFLFTENRARTVELKYAMKEHIAILPLMMESGLADAFNEKCGNFQLLEPYGQDSTAISYESKLDEFLSSIIIGGKLVESIRAEFDAQIFLSYRKIDRVYAQKLMEIIHSIGIFRDVAIWYDEFLTPGADFNDLILDSLDKSNAFVLTVTPNVVAESVDKNGDPCENYIVSTEYPHARGKLPVIPIELVPTDRSALSEKFDGLPSVISANDALVIGLALSQAFSKVKLLSKKGDPKHDYLIGLAYLTGTGVEINRKLGIELITSAAEAGYEDAMVKLASAGILGDGFEQDHREAVKWELKIVELLRDKYLSAEDVFVKDFQFNIYVTRCIVLFKSYLLANMEEEGRHMLEDLAAFLENDVQANPKKRLYALFRVYFELSRRNKSDFDRQTRDKYLNRALEYAKESVRIYKMKFNHCILAETYLKMSECLSDDKNIYAEETKKKTELLYLAFESAKKALTLKDRSDNLSYIRSAEELFFDCAFRCAADQESLGELSSAEYYYEEAEKLATSLLISDASDNNIAYLIKCRSKILKHRLSRGGADAQMYFEKTLEALKRSSGDLIFVKGIKWLSEVYFQIIEYLLKNNNVSDAERYFSEMIALDEKYYDDYETAAAMSGILSVYRAYGEILSRYGNKAGAVIRYKNAIDYYFDSKVFREKYEGYYSDFCMSDTILLCSSCALGCYTYNADLAEECGRKAFYLIGMLKDKETANHEAVKTVISLVFKAFITVLQVIENFEFAEKYALEAIEFFEKSENNEEKLTEFKIELGIIRSNPKLYVSQSCETEKSQISPDSLYKQAVSLLSLAAKHLSVGNVGPAKQNYEKAIKVLGELCDEYPDNTRYSATLKDAMQGLENAENPPAPTKDSNKPVRRGLLSRLFKGKKE